MKVPNFIESRKITYIISLILAIVSIIAIIFLPKNLWIDMTWWTQTIYSYSDVNSDASDINIEKIRDLVKEEAKNYDVINWNTIYSISWKNNFVVETGFQKWDITDLELDNFKTNFDKQITTKLKTFNSSISKEKYISIWKTFWQYIKDRSVTTILIVVLSIAIYVAWAFRWSIKWISSSLFAWITLITLFHDVLIATWIYIVIWLIFPELKIDTYFIAALLTILWYSINDTIVILDRIRSELNKNALSNNLGSNLKLNKSKNINKDKISMSIQDAISKTMTRSIYTSFSLLVILFAMLIFAPTAILWFIITLILWAFIWTYSSIFIAAPVIYDFTNRKK